MKCSESLPPPLPSPSHLSLSPSPCLAIPLRSPRTFATAMGTSAALAAIALGLMIGYTGVTL